MPNVPRVPKLPAVPGWVLLLVFVGLVPLGAQVPAEAPKGLMPNLGRPTKPDDVVPLLDFERYFLGTWTFDGDAPDSVLGPGGVSKGTVTYRRLDEGFYEAVTEGNGEGGAFTIRETIAYHQAQKVAFRHVVDSRGFSYTQTAEIGGNIGGDYRLFFKSAPFAYQGRQIRLNHTIYLAAPLTFRIDAEVAEGASAFMHLSPWRYRRAAPPGAQYVTSRDGTKIAYDVGGTGPVVILLHGGGMNRRSWHTAGYVDRLAKDFTVVTIDIRGNGQSDKPAGAAAYSFERINEDILAVADSVKAQRFALWGFSYGANVGRYLASRSDRVSAMVYIGINFGPAVDETFLGYIKKMPNPETWLTAMIAYPRVEPADMKCPTLWMVGTRNENAFKSAEAYKPKLAGTKVTLAVIEGLTHPQEFEQIDRVFAREFEFTKANAR